MEEKEKVLKQIDNINSSFLDIEKFIPFSPNTLIIWGIVSIVVYLGAFPVYKVGYSYYSLFVGVFIFGAYLTDYLLTKREMKKYNLTKYSKTQIFIEYVFMINVFISILLSNIFIHHNVGYYVYSTWVFFIGFAHFITGYVINNNLVRKTGLMMVAVGILMFVFMSISGCDVCFGYMRYVSALFGGVSLVWLGIMMKKNAKL